jgi:hypothetical protein
MLDWALQRAIPLPVISDSQTGLDDLPRPGPAAAKAVALLRPGFCGHHLHEADERLARS